MGTQDEYAKTRRVYALRHGVEQAVHGISNVLTYSATELWDHDERWRQIQIQANRSLAELIVLRTNLDLLIDVEDKDEEDHRQDMGSHLEGTTKKGGFGDTLA